jgi:dTMP kinase
MITTLENFTPKQAKGFLVVEGVNGAGKSTVINAINQHLIQSGIDVVKTFEPGDTQLGKELRRLLLNAPEIKRHSTAELLLFGADRSEHVDTVIKPALDKKHFVLSDRYLYSTIAFQGYGRGLSLDLINQVNSIAVRDTLPDLVILLDLDPEEGLRRTKGRLNTQKDSFEQEELAFHHRLRNGFKVLAEDRTEPFLIIDAGQSAKEVEHIALSAVDLLIKGFKK